MEKDKNYLLTFLLVALVTVLVIAALATGFSVIDREDIFEHKVGTCTYKGVLYEIGEGFPAGDGCNQCACAGGEVVCTQIACKNENDSFLIQPEEDEGTTDPTQNEEVNITYESKEFPGLSFEYNNELWAVTESEHSEVANTSVITASNNGYNIKMNVSQAGEGIQYGGAIYDSNNEDSFLKVNIDGVEALVPDLTKRISGYYLLTANVVVKEDRADGSVITSVFQRNGYNYSILLDVPCFSTFDRTATQDLSSPNEYAQVIEILGSINLI